MFGVLTSSWNLASSGQLSCFPGLLFADRTTALLAARIILGLWLIGQRLRSFFMPSSLIILPDLHIGYVRLALNYRLAMNPTRVVARGEWHNPCPATVLGECVEQGAGFLVLRRLVFGADHAGDSRVDP